MRKSWLTSLPLFLVLLIIALACSFPTPTVAPMVLPPQPSPTAEVCSVNPAGLGLQVLFGRRDTEGQRVTLNGIGFIPAERLTIRIQGQGAWQTFTVETKDFPVNSDGGFSNQDTLPLMEPAMHWEVYVVHRRGTACLKFVTP